MQNVAAKQTSLCGPESMFPACFLPSCMMTHGLDFHFLKRKNDRSEWKSRFVAEGELLDSELTQVYQEAARLWAALKSCRKPLAWKQGRWQRWIYLVNFLWFVPLFMARFNLLQCASAVGSYRCASWRRTSVTSASCLWSISELPSVSEQTVALTSRWNTSPTHIYLKYWLCKLVDTLI